MHLDFILTSPARFEPISRYLIIYKECDASGTNMPHHSVSSHFGVFIPST